MSKMPIAPARFLWTVALLASVFLGACRVSVNSANPDPQKPLEPGDKSQQDEVHAAARAVAARLDSGRFGDAWDLASTNLKQATSRAVFVNYLGALRNPLGKPGARKIAGFGFTRELKGAPPGEYGFVFVLTDFANANQVEEKFVFQHVGANWELAGYWLSKRVSFGGKH